MFPNMLRELHMMIVGSLDVRHSASLAKHSGRLWELVGKTPNSLQFTATLNLVTFTMRPVFIYVDHTQSSILTVMTTSPLFAWMFNQEEIVDPSLWPFLGLIIHSAYIADADARSTWHIGVEVARKRMHWCVIYIYQRLYRVLVCSVGLWTKVTREGKNWVR